MSEPAELAVDSTSPYPVLPLRDIVIFPYMVTPLFVGRPRSIQALEWAVEHDRPIYLVTQRDPKTDDPQAEELYTVGTLGQVVQMLKLPDGTVKVLVEGKTRARALSFDYGEESIFATVEGLPGPERISSEQTALIRSVNATFENYAGLSKKVPPEMVTTIAAIEEPGRFADTVAAHLNVPITDKQQVLEEADPARRMEVLLTLLEREVEILQIEKKIRNRVKSQMERSQKEYYLNEQMRAIQKELGEKDEFKQELRELEERIQKARMSKEAVERPRGNCASSR